MLILLDGSPFSEEILPKASALATASGAEVTLLRVVETGRTPANPIHATVEDEKARHVLDPLLGQVEPIGIPVSVPLAPSERTVVEPEQFEESLRGEALDYLGTVTRRFFPNGAKTAALLAHHASESIVEYARHEQIDLIAMATHGRTGMASLLMGSVATSILRSGVAPVLLTRPTGLRG